MFLTAAMDTFRGGWEGEGEGAENIVTCMGTGTQQQQCHHPRNEVSSTTFDRCLFYFLSTCCHYNLNPWV